jgi:hypothetical protein
MLATTSDATNASHGPEKCGGIKEVDRDTKLAQNLKKFEFFDNRRYNSPSASSSLKVVAISAISILIV